MSCNPNGMLKLGLFFNSNGIPMKCCMFMGACAVCEWPGFSSHEERELNLKTYLPKVKARNGES